MKIVKIIADKEGQEDAKQGVSRVVEQYDSFMVARATDEQIAGLRAAGHTVVPDDGAADIRIGAADIDTTKRRFDRGGSIRPHPSYGHEEDPGPGTHSYIVQFTGPVREEWLREIEEAGGVLGAPLPSHSYVVEMDGEARARVLKLGQVWWVGHYDPAYRLDPELAEEEKGTTPPGQGRKLPGSFFVSFHTRENLEEALAGVEALGAKVVNVTGARKTITVSFPAEADMGDGLRRLAGLHGVRRIEPVYVMRPHNNVATAIMANLGAMSVPDLPLAGEGEIIAVADTGLDTGEAATVHDDFRGRVKGIESWPVSAAYGQDIKNPGADDGAADMGSGHGTHVAGSVLGDGTRSRAYPGGPIRGLAHKSTLYFQAIEQKLDWKDPQFARMYGEYLLAGLPDDLTELLRQAYAAGARIHTNSWGGGAPGSYGEESRAVDRFVWDHKDMVVLFAAGNDGKDENRDGKVDLGSITPPSTAKNCIAVGASENLRDGFRESYRKWWPENYPVGGLGRDGMTDEVSDIAAFSGRGPCVDQRFKPDVVAPGTFVLSTRSSRCSGGCWQEYDQHYFYIGGTSMATPLTAGAVALIREYLRKNVTEKPSAALVKAALIHTAVRRPYKYAACQGSGLWDPEQGWGHVNLRPFASPEDGARLTFKDVRTGLKTGESKKFRVEVTGSGQPFKATLVWTDLPAGTDLYPSLVNNLNLLVKGPDGAGYHGNIFTPPYDETLDGVNNVEVVFIPEAKPGIYTIQVLASEVKKGSQPFALVYSGGT